jgi:hypothetical protein
VNTWALSLLLSLACTGCVIAHYKEGLPIPADQIPRIVIGQTTKSEILEWFGAPSGMTDGQLLEDFLVDRELTPGPVVDQPFADVLAFRLTRGEVRGFVTIILINYFDIHVTQDLLVVFFDETDRVSSYGYRRGTNALPE